MCAALMTWSCVTMFMRKRTLIALLLVAWWQLSSIHILSDLYLPWFGISLIFMAGIWFPIEFAQAYRLARFRRHVIWSTVLTRRLCQCLFEAIVVAHVDG